MTLFLPLLMIKIFETISIFVIPSFLLLYQYIMFKSGVKFKDDTLPVDLNSLPYLTVLVPTKGEKPEVIQGLLENLSRVKWNEEKLEVIVISDDNEEEFNRLVEKLKVPNKLKARILRRDVKIGYKSGALSYGFNISNGDLILTLDVDARLEKDSLIRAYSHMRSLGCDAVTLNWIGYTTNKHSTLAKGVIISTIIADR
ncbi:MAG: glycosyltransferase family 2 protein [Metallosphaera sp.]